MRIRLCMLLSLLLLICLLPAAAEDGEQVFDLSALEEDENYYSYGDDNGIDTVWRSQSMPWSGFCGEGSADLFLDYVELANEGAVALRLSVSVVLDDMLAADEMTLTVDGKQWRFAVHTVCNEYDQVFMEDYGVCLAGESLGLLDALSGNGLHTVSFTLTGERTVTGTVNVPGEEACALRNKWVFLGGPRQDLSRVEARWPLLR